MVATQAKFHTNCPVELYNKYQDLWKKPTNHDDKRDLFEDILNMF